MAYGRAGRTYSLVVHPRWAELFAWAVALLALACVAWLASRIVAYVRAPKSAPIVLVVTLALLTSVLWAIAGVIVCGDVAAVLGWTNSIEGVAGLVIGAAGASAVCISAYDGGGEVVDPGKLLARTQHVRQLLVIGGLIAIAAGFVLTLVLKAVDPSAINS